MGKKTIKQRKAAIKPWRAMYDGTCPLCRKAIKVDDLVCRSKTKLVIHYVCHPDWVPAPFPGFDHSGRRIKNEN